MATPPRKLLVPLDGIAGLGNALSGAKKGIGELRGALGALGSETSALLADVETAREHVFRVHSDLQFEMSTPGNGGERISDEQSTATAKPVTVGAEETAAPLASGSAAAPESGT